MVQAEAILPPGQSGFVSVPGLADGSGSPHLYDQQQPFIDFDRRSFMFGSASGAPETPKAGVAIRRDAVGVPEITADNANDAWLGAGYAVAQDRLFQLELFRRATTGRLSEILGKDYLDDDLIARRDYYTADERQAMFDALPEQLRQSAEAYRDGVNAWVDHVLTSPQDCPASSSRPAPCRRTGRPTTRSPSASSSRARCRAATARSCATWHPSSRTGRGS